MHLENEWQPGQGEERSKKWSKLIHNVILGELTQLSVDLPMNQKGKISLRALPQFNRIIQNCQGKVANVLDVKQVKILVKQTNKQTNRVYVKGAIPRT